MFCVISYKSTLVPKNVQQASNGHLSYFWHAFFQALLWGHRPFHHPSSPLFISNTGSQWHLPFSYMVPQSWHMIPAWPISAFSWEQCSFLCGHEGEKVIARSCFPDCTEAYLSVEGQHKADIWEEGQICERGKRERQRKWETELRRGKN